MKLPVTLYLFLYTIIGSGCITLRSSAEHSCFCKLHEMRQLLAQTLLQLHQLLLQSLIGGMDKACQTYLTDSLPFDIQLLFQRNHRDKGFAESLIIQHHQHAVAKQKPMHGKHGSEFLIRTCFAVFLIALKQIRNKSILISGMMRKHAAGYRLQC